MGLMLQQESVPKDGDLVLLRRDSGGQPGGQRLGGNIQEILGAFV